MASASQEKTVRALLDLHGQTYADELGIKLARPGPSALFRLLCASVLFSARIGSQIATEAGRELSRRGWKSSAKLLDSTWEQRVEALNNAGYTRYQERTATMLGDVAEALEDRYDGDLRKLRDEADRDPKAERRLLKQFKGLGDVGVDIFFREVQVAWDELRPFADRRALDAAKRLKLGSDAQALEKLAGGKDDYARLVAALVRTEIDDDYGAVRKAARG